MNKNLQKYAENLKFIHTNIIENKTTKSRN